MSTFLDTIKSEPGEVSNAVDSIAESEYEKLKRISRSKRISCGVEEIKEFSSKYAKKACFYCNLCLDVLNEDDVVSHTSSYSHLFRYAKKNYPIEYKRLITNQQLDDAIRNITNLLKILMDKRVLKENSTSKYVFVNERDFDREYYNYVDNFHRQKKLVDLDEINENELNFKNSRDEKLEFDQMHDDMRRNLCKSTRTPDFLRLIMGGGDGDDEYLSAQPCAQAQVQPRNHQQQSQRSNNNNSNNNWQARSNSSGFRSEKFSTEQSVSQLDPRQANRNSQSNKQREKAKQLEIKAVNIVQGRESIDDEYILELAEHFDQIHLSRACLNEFLAYFQNRLDAVQAASGNMFIDTLCIKQEKF